MDVTMAARGLTGTPAGQQAKINMQEGAQHPNKETVPAPH